MSDIDANFAREIAAKNGELWERTRKYITKLEDLVRILTARAAEFEDRALAAERQMMAMCERETVRTGTISERGIGLDGGGVTLMELLDFELWLESEEE